MLINKLKTNFGPSVLERELRKRLKDFSIELYNIEMTSKSLKFRAKRTYNNKYVGGGVRFGDAIYFNNFYQPKWKNAKHLHWEEWAVINDLINVICDEHDLDGSCKIFFDRQNQYIRKNGERWWSSNLSSDELYNLQEKHIADVIEEVIL